MRLATLTLALAAGSLLAPIVTLADTPGRHPSYLHARTDLRMAQLYLRGPIEPNVEAHMRAADREINAAVHALDEAAKFDNKNLNDHPNIDTAVDRTGRFRSAMELLTSARRDIGGGEDNLSAIGWRDGAYRHIDAAIDHVKRAAHDLHVDHELGW